MYMLPPLSYSQCPTRLQRGLALRLFPMEWSTSTVRCMGVGGPHSCSRAGGAVGTLCWDQRQRPREEEGGKTVRGCTVHGGSPLRWPIILASLSSLVFLSRRRLPLALVPSSAVVVCSAMAAAISLLLPHAMQSSASSLQYVQSLLPLPWSAAGSASWLLWSFTLSLSHADAAVVSLSHSLCVLLSMTDSNDVRLQLKPAPKRRWTDGGGPCWGQHRFNAPCIRHDVLVGRSPFINLMDTSSWHLQILYVTKHHALSQNASSFPLLSPLVCHEAPRSPLYYCRPFRTNWRMPIACCHSWDINVRSDQIS
jgi:hypothetical protein